MKLFSPKTEISRPITDRVKGSLFSVLYKYEMPAGKKAADLFCGVGSLGLEALSRGAEFVSFVEKDPAVIAVLNRNIEKAGFIGTSKVVRANAFRMGAPVGSDEKRYELVFVDPPYSMTKETGIDSLLGGLMAILSQQLEQDGIVIVRTDKRISLLEQYGRLETIEHRRWGTMAVTILRKKADDE